MNQNETIKQAIFNIGGPTIASSDLGVSRSTIFKWIRKGVIPNLNLAKRVADASGFQLDLLRPRYKQEAM